MNLDVILSPYHILESFLIFGNYDTFLIKNHEVVSIYTPSSYPASSHNQPFPHPVLPHISLDILHPQALTLIFADVICYRVSNTVWDAGYNFVSFRNKR
ncbi:hypothetical protein HanPI659440_Chr17g0699301 [Helianthus annuus]|nr:hypothetical protein HanPI659440_Chr17g0699301 [Helianthus annuus]